MTLEETLATLKKFGLLDRTEAVKVGDITVTMGAAAPAGDAPDLRPMSAAEESAAVEEIMYGASRGFVPDVS